MEAGVGSGGTPGGQRPLGVPRVVLAEVSSGASSFDPQPSSEGRGGLHAASAPGGGAPLGDGGFAPFPPALPSPAARARAEALVGHGDGRERPADVTCLEPGSRGESQSTKRPVTFLCWERNPFLEAFLENLNLVGHQLFIIREAYV